MTLVVLGLDAADYRLAKRWGCDELLLDRHSAFETESHSLGVPATLEVWPSIATGLRPDEHGVVLDPENRPTRPFLHRLATRAIRQFPDMLEKKLLDLKRSQFGAVKPTTDESHVFETGVVTNWPGITPCHDWVTEGEWFSAVTAGDMSEDEFDRNYLAHVGQQIGWAAGAAAAEYPVAGVHVHYLDHMGHLFAKRPDRLREAYEVADSFVGWLREQVDDVLVLSDHGMQTTATDDDSPGVHSWHAMTATSLDDAPPESVLDVRNWVEKRIDEPPDDENFGGVDAPTGHLRDLGYV